MRTAPRLPRSRLERVRRWLSFFGLLMMAQLMFSSLETRVETRYVLLSLAANLALVGLVALTMRYRGSYLIALIPISALLATVTGIGLSDPLSVIGVCLGLVVGQTMYGSRRSIVLRVICLVPVVPLSVYFSASPLGEQIAWNGQPMLATLPGIPVFAGLIFLLRNGLESQAKTLARETFMAKLSSGLLAAGTVHDIAPVMIQANEDLVHLSPGLITLELQRIGPGEPGPEGGARVLNQHGHGPGDQIPTIIPSEALTELPAFGVEGSLPLRSGSPALTRLGLPPRRWRAIALERDPQAPCDLILHGVRAGLGQKLFGVLSPEEQEFEAIIGLMSRHWRAAMIRVEQRAALLEAEEQDDVTGLPDRSATMRRIVELVHGDRHRVGLILLELTGLDRVEADGGIAAADVAMNQLAYRIVEEVGEHDYVGRGGDASFAVLIPRADSFDEMEDLVERLENSLLEPVLLPGGAASLSLKVGVARTTEDGTAAELLDRAVGAMVLHETDNSYNTGAFEVR